MLVIALVVNTMPLASLASTSTQQLPKVALVKLWEISHTAYMAKFVDEKYIVVFGSHGDVSLDGRFISSRGDCWVYTVDGELLGTLSGGTYEVVSWEPFQAVKVWDYSGFFSADSKRMVEEIRVLGTSTSVVDTESWTEIPIEWGFSASGSNFYAIQLDYSGSTLAVGYIGSSLTNDTAKLLVFKYDPEQNKYVKVFEHVEYGDYGRRLQMTLDGNVILVGGALYPYLDIFVWNDEIKNYTRIVHYRLPDESGIGALGISDPWNVGYIIIGTRNGWAIIGKLEVERIEVRTGNVTSTLEVKGFRVIFQEKFAPDGSWIYNPFYERWIPKVTEIFALTSHRDSSRPGYSLIYDVLTNQSIVIHFAGAGSPQWSAAAVSPGSNYVFIGNSLYIVVRRGVESGVPRVRFWGTAVFERGMHDLSSPIVFEAPERDWRLYFYSGRVTISRVYTESIPVTLTDDPDVLEGRLGRMYYRGLVTAYPVVESSGSVDKLVLETRDVPEAGFDAEHVVASTALYNVKALYGWNGHGFGGATVSSAIAIDVPFTAPLEVYSEVKLKPSIAVVTVAPVFDPWKELLGVFGLEFVSGGISFATGKALASKAAEIAIEKAIAWGLAKSGTTISLKTLDLILTSAETATKVGSKALGIVGIALIVDAGIGAYTHYLAYSSVRSFIINLAVVEDKYGNKYGAVAVVLPSDEISRYSSEYYEHIESIAKRYGLKDVGITFIAYGKTWDEYKEILKTGRLPTIDLKSLVETTIASKYGYSLSELRITGAKIIIETLVHGKANLWDYVTGGLKVPVTTLVAGAAIEPKAVTAGGKVYTDPAVIADMIRTVYINGKEFELAPGVDGAYVDFAIQLGSDKLTISVGKKGLFADVRIETDVVVEKPFEPLGDYGYVAELHYDWSDTIIRISRIEFVDMPYPMVYAEREFKYRYGSFVHDITDAFELSNKTIDTTSPSGYRYYYITKENTKFIDPANGGIMQPCKTYIFRYFYKYPPDVSIKVLLNGTKVTSTLAHHATVVISSINAEQDVRYELTVNIKYLEGVEEKLLNYGFFVDTVHVRENGTAYRIYDITPYVDMAITFMQSQGKVAFIELIGKIVEAKEDYRKDNNEYRIIYYPPPTLPQTIPEGNFSVTVRVYEYDAETYSWRPSVGAVVTAYYGYEPTESRLSHTNVTDENGTAKFILPSGTWTFIASKEGYLSSVVTATIFNDTFINLYLSPAPKPGRENRTYVPANASVTFHVYNGENANPVANATVTARLIEPVNSTYYNMTFTAVTDSSGYAGMTLPLGRYEVTVNASGYKLFRSTYIIDRDVIINIPLVPETLTDYAALRVIVIYSDWKPYEGAHVEVRNATDGSLIAVLATNSFGNASLTLPRNQKYNVSVHVVEELYNREYFDYEVINLTEDLSLVFVVPWNSSQPPIYVGKAMYYWLTVEVTWANGLPFHGAVVSVYNYTSGALISSMPTNGTGTVHFLLPAFKMYTVFVNATNPYNASQKFTGVYIVNLTDNRWITVKLPWLPEEAGLSRRYRLIVFAYDVSTGEGVEGVQVVVSRGETAWTARTNSTGYAEVWVPLTGLYNVTGIHRDYEPIYREVFVFENNTLVNLPLSPVLIPVEVPPPPINGTEYPPIVINGTNHYWLSVQVLWKDGYPFSKALVTVYNRTDGSVMFQQYTNGTGFVHFLIPENASIKVTVNATHPENASLTFYDERELNMTQHWYIVFMVPWESKYYSPEVWLKSVKLVIHRGQGYFFGNVSHLVILTIWTNKPQTVTIHLELINATSNTTVASKDVTVSLKEGVNTIFEWLDINASKGGYFRVFANITQWEYDTDLTNNWGWSDVKYLKPMVDIQVFVVWRPIEQKQSWTILPEDLIEIDIGIKLPINTSSIPAKLLYNVEFMDLKEMVHKLFRGGLEDVRAAGAGVVWRNMTVTVPWTSVITVFVNVTHPWEDFGYNNVINITIPIDPDVKVNITERPSYVVFEGQVFKVVVNLTSNVEPGKGVGWISIIDNTTATLLKRVPVTLQPQLTLELYVKAPENPAMFGFIRTPTTLHTVSAVYAGYDLYEKNNIASFEFTVISYQWASIIAFIVILIIVLAIIRAVTHTIASITTRRTKFVKRRFVRRKE